MPTALADADATILNAVISNQLGFTIPSNHPPNVLTIAPIVNTTFDSTWLGHFFQAGTIVGVQFVRLGSFSSDTWESDINLAATMLFTFSRRCQLICCP